MKLVISGSFRKHLAEIDRARELFLASGIEVLAPRSAESAGMKKEFVVLRTDAPDASPYELELDFLRQIERADFLFVMNVDGYIGQSVRAEIAHARLAGVPVVFAEGSRVDSETPVCDNERAMLETTVQDLLRQLRSEHE